MSEPLVVIGNGMAAARFVEELSARALGRYAVAVIGEEPRLAYNRVLLSALLADEVGFDDIELRPARWWRDRGVTLRYGVRATEIDPIARTEWAKRLFRPLSLDLTQFLTPCRRSNKSPEPRWHAP